MLNELLKKLTGKDIIIFNRHRNSVPLLNAKNRQHFFFWNSWWLVKGSAVFGRQSKLRYRMLALFLDFIGPHAILDINWTTRHHDLFHAWCRRNRRRFIVFQHGSHIAGVICDIREKYVNCTTFLVWGEHFRRLAEHDNPENDFECLVFGNPVYNEVERGCINYSKSLGNRVLVAVSVMEGARLEALSAFLRKLATVGCRITVREHNLQARISTPIEGFRKTVAPLYQLLSTQQFDVVLTDISSAMLDAIFYKNRVVFFSPPGDDPAFTKNVYSCFLPNLANRADDIGSFSDLCRHIDISQQEELLQQMVAVSGTDNRLDNLDEKLRQQAGTRVNPGTQACEEKSRRQ